MILSPESKTKIFIILLVKNTVWYFDDQIVYVSS